MPVVNFFMVQHEIGFVVLAALVCMISAYACVGLLRHAHRDQGTKRNVWTMIAALAVGFGIWSTHFIAMLAFRPGFTLQYDPIATAGSLGIAILMCGAGIAMAVREKGKADKFLGGALVGLAISSMHYTGIAALVMGGRLQWNAQLIAVSIIAGIVLGGLAFLTAMGGGARRLIGGALLLTLAICAMHFTAMSAADFSNCFPLSANGQIDSFWLSIALGLAAVLVIGAAVASMLLDDADRRRTAREEQRQQYDAARIAETSGQLEMALHHMAQGLSLYDANGLLQLYNDRLLTVLGLDSSEDYRGRTFDEMVRLVIGKANYPAEDVDRITKMVVDKHWPLIRTGGEVTEEFNADRVIKVSHSPVGDGSCVTTVQDVTERSRSERAIAYMARHDALTGLPNRAHFIESFEDYLVGAAAQKEKLGVIAIDLDRFKEINDSHGHAAGDAVLKRLADRVSAVLQDDEMVARLGGDEFAAIKRFASMSCLRDFLRRLEGAVSTRLEIEGLHLNISGSIGVAIYPDDGKNRSKLLSNADLALYRAKDEVERRICYYEKSMDEQARERREMVRDLWEAVEHNAFHLAYQVQKSVVTGAITGYEVLLRWNRPGHGLVSPADFIPVAEECGAIHAIGTWVLKTACREAARWPEPYKIAVNVSGLQVIQTDLIETVRQTLMLTGLSPARLELEVTETSIIADKLRALHVLRQIRAMGVSIAIDDFGTGYSSLDTLRSFPFDKIKLDRSFMREVESNDQSKAIVRAILALGRSLSVPVLAEGVETSEQLEVLRKEGCNEAQGYLLGRPGAIDWADRFGVLEERLLA